MSWPIVVCILVLQKYKEVRDPLKGIASQYKDFTQYYIGCLIELL